MEIKLGCGVNKRYLNPLSLNLFTLKSLFDESHVGNDFTCFCSVNLTFLVCKKEADGTNKEADNNDRPGDKESVLYRGC